MVQVEPRVLLLVEYSRLAVKEHSENKVELVSHPAGSGSIVPMFKRHAMQNSDAPLSIQSNRLIR